VDALPGGMLGFRRRPNRAFAACDGVAGAKREISQTKIIEDTLMREIPALDGYRGVAVLMVILFHAR
jgi:hypothetical protein